MRWAALFADLEAQLEAAEHADQDARVLELTRVEVAAVTLADRLRGVVGASLQVRLRDGADERGVLCEVADTWFLLDQDGRQVLVPMSAVSWAHGIGLRVVEARTRVSARLTLGHVLRALSRDRVAVQVSVDHTALVGRIDRVGRDYLEIADLAVERSSERPRGTVVPFAALLSVAELR
ncbi:MAG: hypothetical protein ACTMIR_09890 [Cellulomonadaceae bacterium]